MACSQNLSNIARDCSPAKGGIVECWFATWTPGIFTVSANTDNFPIAVTAIDSGTTWYHYEFRKGTGSMNSTQNVDEANGLNFVETDVLMRFGRMETVKRTGVAALALGGVAGIVRDANNSYWALGVDEEMFPAAGTAQTGTAATDGNFYEITLRDTYQSFPLEIPENVFQTITVAS